MEASVLRAVINAARRRQRRRQLLGLTVLVALAGAGLLAYELVPGPSSPRPAAVHPSGPIILPPALPTNQGGIETLVVGTGETNPHRLRPFDPIGIFLRPRVTSDEVVTGLDDTRAAAYRRKAHLGRELFDQSRLFRNPLEDVYVVPTTTGAICFWTANSSGCVRGLLPAGVNWVLSNDGSESDLTLKGVAAERVSRIDLFSGRAHRRATLDANIFVVDWPDGISAMSINGGRGGRLVVHYRDGRSALVSLN